MTLSPRTHIPRPAFVYRRGFNTTTPGLLALVRGDQLWQLSRFDEAQADYEAAVAAENPRLPQAKWKLATAYLRSGDAERALALLEPLAKSFHGQFEVVAGLGLGYYLKGDYGPDESTILNEPRRSDRPIRARSTRSGIRTSASVMTTKLEPFSSGRSRSTRSKTPSAEGSNASRPRFQRRYNPRAATHQKLIPLVRVVPAR